VGAVSRSQLRRSRGQGLLLHHAFRLLFQSAGKIACDSPEIKKAIESYRIIPDKITAIATFSNQYLKFSHTPWSHETAGFLSSHNPVIFSYLAFRPEYRLEVVREGMKRFREQYPRAGFLWLGFPDGEMPQVRAFVNSWSEAEQGALHLLGNLTHDEFLTLMTRSDVYLRSPACDGVAASVLEALAWEVPVVASENGRRPDSVVTYQDEDPADMCAKMIYAVENRDSIFDKRRDLAEGEDNIARMADWLTG